jgi:hypothetical protein
VSDDRIFFKSHPDCTRPCGTRTPTTSAPATSLQPTTCCPLVPLHPPQTAPTSLLAYTPGEGEERWQDIRGRVRRIWDHAAAARRSRLSQSALTLMQIVAEGDLEPSRCSCKPDQGWAKPYVRFEILKACRGVHRGRAVNQGAAAGLQQIFFRRWGGCDFSLE